MSEGKLKEFLRKRTRMAVVYSGEVNQLLDEAKANFPNQKNKKYETISEASGFDWLLYEADIDVWFEKWFGNGETK